MKRVLCTLLVCCLLLSGCGKQKENQLISKEYSQQEQLDAESYVIGMEYYASAKYNEAIISFLKVSDESTLKSAAMVGLAECRIALGDTETAQKELAEYLQKVNGSGIYSCCCGTIPENVGELGAQKVTEYYNQVDRYSSTEDMLQVYLLLSRIYETRGEFDHALETLEMASRFFETPVIENAITRVKMQEENYGKFNSAQWMEQQIAQGKDEFLESDAYLRDSEANEDTKTETETTTPVSLDPTEISVETLEQLFTALKAADFKDAHALISDGSLNAVANSPSGVYYTPGAGEPLPGIKDGEGILVKMENTAGSLLYSAFYSQWKNGDKDGVFHGITGTPGTYFTACETSVKGNELNGEYKYIKFVSGADPEIMYRAEGTVTANSMSGPTQYWWEYACSDPTEIVLFDGYFADAENVIPMDPQIYGMSGYMVTIANGAGIPLNKNELLTWSPGQAGYVAQDINNAYKEVAPMATEEKVNNQRPEYAYEIPLQYAKELEQRYYYEDYNVLFRINDLDQVKVGQEANVYWREYFDESFTPEDFVVTTSDESMLKVITENQHLSDDSYSCKVLAQGEKSGTVEVTVSIPKKNISVSTTINILIPHNVELADGRTDVVWGYWNNEVAEEIVLYLNQYRMEHGKERLETHEDTQDFSATRAMESAWYMDSQRVYNMMNSVANAPFLDWDIAEAEEERAHLREDTGLSILSTDELHDYMGDFFAYAEEQKKLAAHIRPNKEPFEGGENILGWSNRGSESAGYDAVYFGWHNSAGHRANMLGDYKSVSAGCFVTDNDAWFFVTNFYNE